MTPTVMSSVDRLNDHVSDRHAVAFVELDHLAYTAPANQ
jgi:hypothetical protein